MKKILFAILLVGIITFTNTQAQNIGIGTNTPNASALLDVSSTNKGILFPRMSTAQRNDIISPATGLIILNTDDLCTDMFDGSNWIKTCGLRKGDSAFLPVVYWAEKAFFPAGRVGGVGFSIGNKGYFGTGFDYYFLKKDFWEFDLSSNVWVQKAEYGGGITKDAVGFSIGSKGYVGTGFKGSYKDDFWEYDPSTNTWEEKANFGGGMRVDAVGFSIGNKGYIGTGYDGSYKNDFWEYDPINDVWLQKTNFGGVGRRSAVGFFIDNKGYIGTGFDGSYKNDFWEYNPLNNSWIARTSLQVGRENAVGFSIGSKGYIGTGFNGTYKSDFWEFNPSTNAWEEKPYVSTLPYNISKAFSDAVGFSIGNRGYIVTGSDDQIFNIYFFEYNGNVIPPKVASYSSGPPLLPQGNISDGIWTKTSLNVVKSNFANINIVNGKLGIGTDNPFTELHVIGNILASGTVSPSDIRYKKDIRIIPNAIKKLLKLNGVYYNLRTNEFPQMGFSKTEQVGLLAQDVEKVIPNVVFTNTDGYKGIDYAKLIPLLIESIKELKKENDVQQKQIEELKKMIKKILEK